MSYILVVINKIRSRVKRRESHNNAASNDNPLFWLRPILMYRRGYSPYKAVIWQDRRMIHANKYKMMSTFSENPSISYHIMKWKLKLISHIYFTKYTSRTYTNLIDIWGQQYNTHTPKRVQKWVISFFVSTPKIKCMRVLYTLFVIF